MLVFGKLDLSIYVCYMTIHEMCQKVDVCHQWLVCSREKENSAIRKHFTTESTTIIKVFSLTPSRKLMQIRFAGAFCSFKVETLILNPP